MTSNLELLDAGPVYLKTDTRVRLRDCPHNIGRHTFWIENGYWIEFEKRFAPATGQEQSPTIYVTLPAGFHMKRIHLSVDYRGDNPDYIRIEAIDKKLIYRVENDLIKEHGLISISWGLPDETMTFLINPPELEALPLTTLESEVKYKIKSRYMDL